MSTIKPVGLFHTPENMQELQDWLAQFTGQEAAAVNTAAFMAWNLAAKLTAQADEQETPQWKTLGEIA